jgi:hypothetical protein
MYIPRRNRYPRNQGLIGQPIIAFFVLRRDPALVPPKQMDLTPRDHGSKIIPSKMLIEASRSLPTGKGYGNPTFSLGHVGKSVGHEFCGSPT